MKITAVEVAVFSAGDALAHVRTRWAELVRRHNPRRIAVPPDEMAVLRITTDDGAEGCCIDILRRGRPDAVEALLHPLLEGEDPLLRERLWLRMADAGVPMAVLSLADVALWDLAGRVAGLPVWVLAGGCRRRVKVYATPHPDFGSPADYAEHALACKRRGYHGYKIHGCLSWDPLADEPVEPWTRSFPEQDLEICRAVRRAVGDGFPLMLDPAYVYDMDESLAVGRELEKLGFAWFESPMPERPDTMDSYVTLCRELAIPVVAPECLPGSYVQRAEWLRHGACDINRIDPHYGGITACLKAAAMCQAHGVRLELHSTASNQHNLQVLGATDEGTCTYLEDYDLDPEGGLAYVGANFMVPDGAGRRYPFLRSPPAVIDAGGCAVLPDEPGLAMLPDWDYIAANRKQVRA